MAKEYMMMPNEAIILKEVGIAHGGVMASYTDELMLTNLNIICTSKGVFGNIKKIYQYPLSQIKKYNGRPQVLSGNKSNGSSSLEVYFINGGVETFNFQWGNRRKIRQWIDAIDKLIGGGSVDQSAIIDADDYDDGGTVVGVIKEVGGQVKDVGAELLGSLGFRPRKKKESVYEKNGENVSKRCASCSAPLVGRKGHTVKCKYCDTEQIL